MTQEKQSLQTQNQELTIKISNIEVQVNSTLPELKNLYQEQIKNLNTQISQVQSNVQDQISKLNSTYQTQKEKISQQINQTVTDIYNTVNGNIDWNSFLQRFNITSPQKFLQSTFEKAKNKTAEQFTKLKDAFQTLKGLVNTVSSAFTSQTSQSASQTKQSLVNINSLDTTTINKSQKGKSLFDFSFFQQTIDEFSQLFDTIKGSFDMFKDLFSNTISQSVKQVQDVINPNTWTSILDEALQDFKSMEQTYKMNFEDIQNQTKSYVQQISVELVQNSQAILQGMSLTQVINDFTSCFQDNTLNKLMDFQSMKDQVIDSLISSLASVQVTLYKNSKSIQTSPILVIPTPIGPIVVYINVYYEINVNFGISASRQGIEIELNPNGIVQSSALGGLNLCIVETGAGVSLSANAALPVDFGLVLQTSEFYGKCQLIYSLSGQAGVYIKYWTVSWSSRCWKIWRKRICIPVPRFSWSSPKYIVSVGYSTGQKTVVIFYKEFDF